MLAMGVIKVSCKDRDQVLVDFEGSLVLYYFTTDKLWIHLIIGSGEWSICIMQPFKCGGGK